ncbi:cysteine--tRNA ligase [Hyphobacterium sp. CCMP332]|nr:cysteine--tRNA ligase [Hyphobacterium sp. CCMP332]
MKYKTYPVSLVNSISRKKEDFKPAVEGYVGMYVCGPTVYSDVHLGNVRTFTSFDLIYRYFLFLGYKVRYVRNITDVGHLLNDEDSGEDKIAKKAKLENLEPMEIVQKYTNGFHQVMQLFNTLPPSIEPTATAHIIEQIEMVQKILKEGFAYESKGSVYFDVEKYNKSYKYGSLTGRNIEDMISNTRDLDGQDEKRNPLDFAIWKKAEDNHIMRWNSPWGLGFPGWHLECSVMSNKYLGEQFDIHGGGMDLKFPHHECEIAQNRISYDKDPIKYWIHTNMLTVNGKKMSKSEGNGFTPSELMTGNHPLLDQGFSPMTIRFFMLQAHYASTLDFSNDALRAAEKGYKKLMKSLQNLQSLNYEKAGKINEALDMEIKATCEQCYQNMSDDFNSAKTLANLFDLSTKINAIKDGAIPLSNISKDTFNFLEKTYRGFIETVLGLIPEEENQSSHLDAAMEILMGLRADAKRKKDYALTDKIRDELQKAGIKIMDGKEGKSSYIIE